MSLLARPKTMSRRTGFTVKKLANAMCPTGKDRIWIYDARESGLCLMVTSTGAKSYYLYRKFEGKPQRIRLGGFGEIKIEQARDLAQKKKGKQADGIDLMVEKRDSRAKGTTIGELFAWFLESWAKPRKTSWHDDELRYNKHLKPWAARRLVDITLADVSTLHQNVAKATSQPTANRVLALLSTMYSKSKLMGYAGANPCKGVEKFSEESRERFLSPEELPKIMAALDDDKTDSAWRDYFKLLLLTGARRANMLSMRWDELDLDAARWTIPGAKSKNGKPMTIALSLHAVKILRKRENASEWVFPSYGSTGHLMSPDPSWVDVCSRAGVAEVRIHDLRRTFGSWQAAAGVSLPTIGKTLGHRSAAATAVYARLHLDSVRQAVDSTTAAMMAAAKPPKKKGRPGRR